MCVCVCVLYVTHHHIYKYTRFETFFSELILLYDVSKTTAERCLIPLVVTHV